MAKDSVRLKKKKDKQRLQKRFPKAPKNATYNELKQREAAADKAKEQREARYQRNLAKIKESGLDISISKSMSDKQVDELIKKEKTRQSRKKTQEKKISLLMEQGGLSREDAEEFKNATYKEIYELIHITYTSDKYIGVCWWDSTGETNMMTALNELKYMTLSEKIEQIHKLYQESLDNPGGSDDFAGVARFVHGNSKEYVQNQLDAYKNRGYLGKVPYNYVNIGISNEFSVEGITDMLYLAMVRTSNQHRKRIYEDVRFFMHTNVPEIYRRIWE